MDRMFGLIVASCARVAANHRGEGTDPPDGTPSSVAVFLGAKDTISSRPTASAKRSSIRQVGLVRPTSYSEIVCEWVPAALARRSWVNPAW